MSVSFLTLLFKYLVLLLKNRCHLRHHTFQKSQKYKKKIIKKSFLQLRCSNALLHLKYKVLLCEPKIEFNKLAGGKALATDHCVRVNSSRGEFCYL